MSDSRTRELIQAEVDGALDEAGRAELEQVLADSPEARAFRDEIQRLVHALEALPQEEPPADLHGRIVREISLPRPSRWRAWFGPLNASAVLRYGAAGVAGAVMTLAVVGSREALQLPGDPSQMVGTIARGIEAPVAGEVDRFSMTGETGRAEGALSRTADGWFLQMEFDAAGPLDLTLDLQDTGLSFDGVLRQGRGLSAIDWSDGRVRGRIEGSERVTFVLRGAGEGGPIGVELSGEGMPKARARLNTRGP